MLSVEAKQLVRCITRNFHNNQSSSTTLVAPTEIPKLPQKWSSQIRQVDEYKQSSTTNPRSSQSNTRINPKATSTNQEHTLVHSFHHNTAGEKLKQNVHSVPHMLLSLLLAWVHGNPGKEHISEHIDYSSWINCIQPLVHLSLNTVDSHHKTNSKNYASKRTILEIDRQPF